jgi:hypothetical protein
VPLVHETLVVLVLPRVPRADGREDRELVALVHAPGHTLRGVHADPERLAALLASVENIHSSPTIAATISPTRSRLISPFRISCGVTLSAPLPVANDITAPTGADAVEVVHSKVSAYARLIK